MDGKVYEVGESDNGEIGALICQEQWGTMQFLCLRLLCEGANRQGCSVHLFISKQKTKLKSAPIACSNKNDGAWICIINSKWLTT